MDDWVLLHREKPNMISDKIIESEGNRVQIGLGTVEQASLTRYSHVMRVDKSYHP